MRLTVIGSDSFIAQELLRRSRATSIKGISRTVARTDVERVVPDLTTIDTQEFEAADAVLNFAAIVHRPDIKDSSTYDAVNHQLAVLNARKAKRAGAKLYVQMSTIAVYGNASRISIGTPCDPRTPYGASKLAADEELRTLEDDTFRVAVVRPPMVYGGGAAPGNMMRLIRLADSGIPLPFKGVDNRRDFIHVHNLVQYLDVIAQRRLDGVFLVTDHQPVSTEQLLELIAKHLHRRARMIRVPRAALELLRRLRPSEYDKLFGSLTIEPSFPCENAIQRHPVEEGIAQMVEHYRQINSANQHHAAGRPS